MDTNKVLLTVDDIFRMKGVRPGYEPTDLEYEQAVKTVEDLNKQKLQAMMMPEQKVSVTGGSFTNAEGRVTDYIVKPKGVDVQLLEPKVLTTPAGTFTMKSPTNAVPVLLPDGSIAQNYTSDPLAGEAPQTIGAYGAQPQQTPATTPAPQAAPAPSPAPMPQTNQMVRVISPDGKRGSIPASQVDQALQQGFRLAP